MERWIGRNAVVTGASSGIGRAIVEQFIKAGINVVGIARRMHLLENLAERLSQKTAAKFYPLQCDVSHEENVIKAFSWIEENVGAVHIMINNAGIYAPTTIINGDIPGWKNTLNVNVIALCVCTKLALKSMKSHEIDDGQIIHIGSIASHYTPYVDPPCLNVYPASKHCVRAATETLRRELRFQKSNIRVCCVCPGFVDTEFLSAGSSSEEEGLVNPDLPILKPEDIAEICEFILSMKPHCQIHDVFVRALGEMA